MALAITEIISIAYQTILFVVGVPGNLLIILTYCRRQQRTSSSIFIIALALADLGVCLMSPAVIYNYVIYYDYPSNPFCKFRYYTNHGLIYVSRFLTIAVAIERYLAICKPMSKRIQPKWAAVVAVVCVPVGYVLTIPIAIAFRTRDLPGGRTVCYPDTSDPAIKWVLKVTFPITFLIGLIIVVFCYGCIYRAIRKQMHVRAQMMTGPGKSSSGSVFKAMEDTTSSSNQKNTQISFVKDSKPEKNDTAPSENPLSHVNGVEQSGAFVNIIPTSSTVASDEENSASSDKWISSGNNVEASGKASLFSCCAKKKTSTTKSRSDSMDSTTKMLLIVTIIYFVSFLPQFVTIMIPTRAMINFRMNHKKGYQVFAVVRRFITVNHIVNPFVYGFVNKRFRKDCWAAIRYMKEKFCSC